MRLFTIEAVEVQIKQVIIIQTIYIQIDVPASASHDQLLARLSDWSRVFRRSWSQT